MSPRRIEIPNRFWSKVSKGPSCWEWMAGKTRHGYGRFGIGSKLYLSHRVSYELVNGVIPEGLFIDHICHNPGCVNPGHLRTATNKQNMENREGPTRKNLSSGIRGVSWHKATRKWMVYAGHYGRIHHAGLFVSLEEAEAAAIALRKSLFTHSERDKKDHHVQPN